MASTRPRRVAARPDPAAWGEDELLSFSEAAALLWPDGPLTASSLRTAYRAGELEVTMAVHLPSTPKKTNAQRKVRPLVKSDANRDGADRWIGSQSPVARRYGGYGHPVHGIAPDSGGRQLTDDRRKSAADETELHSRAPALGGPKVVVRIVARNQRRPIS